MMLSGFVMMTTINITATADDVMRCESEGDSDGDDKGDVCDDSAGSNSGYVTDDDGVAGDDHCNY